MEDIFGDAVLNELKALKELPHTQVIKKKDGTIITLNHKKGTFTIKQIIKP